MATLQVTGIEIRDNSIPGSAISQTADFAYTQFAQRPNQTSPIPLTSCRQWDAMGAIISTPANDDLGLVTGTPGTDAPMLSAGDVKALGSSARKTAFELEVPANYDDAASFEIRIRAAVETTIADVACTVDLQVFKPDGDGAVGADLCTTGAQSINSTTPANKDFVIDASGIDPGDKLLCVVTIAYNDGATVTAVTPVIYQMFRRCDTRG